MPEPPDWYETVDETVFGVPMEVFAHRHRSIRDLLRSSEGFGEREYLVDDAHRVTFAQHLRHVASLATVLRGDYHVRVGDRVAVLARNSVEWAVAFWAAASAGAIVAPMNSFWSPSEFSAAMDLAEPVVVLGDADSLDPVEALHTGVPRISFEEELWPAAGDPGCDFPVVMDDEDDPALLIFTSGTTGRPKAVTHSHRGVCGFVQCQQYNLVQRSLGATAPQPVPRFLVTAPLFHVSVLHGVLMMQLGMGGCAVILRGRFDPARVIRTIEAERVTTWPALGSAAPRVAAHPDVATHDLSSLRALSVGGAPVSPAVQDALRAAFPHAAQGLRMGYSSSESVSIVASIGGREYEEHPTSTGPVQTGAQVEIRDEQGLRVPDGVDGEVHVRSPYIMLGYWGDPDATAAVMKPGRWLAMGDVGQLRDGRLYINSRARDLVFVSAENVFPTEVEYRLDAHPAVVESAVVGVDDPITGQALQAHVVPVQGSQITTDDLATWCAAGLARYKVPTRWVIRSEPLPRTASGKVSKVAL